MNQAIPKLSALLQTTGEAQYTSDLGASLYGQLVYLREASGTIAKIDASQALACAGVVDYISKDDIPTGGDGAIRIEPQTVTFTLARSSL